MQEKPGTACINDAAIPLRKSAYLAVLFISMAVLLLQIALTRIFSYTIWYHFTYVTISLAMLGFGASGAVLASSEKLAAMDIKLAQGSSLVAAVSVPLMLLVVSKVPFYPFQLFEDPLQVLYLILYYIAVTLPFFCGGLTIACVFRSKPALAPRIYFSDLLGAGLGCLVTVTAINIFGVPGVAALSATLFLFAAALFLTPSSKMKAMAILAVALVWIFLGMNIETVLQFKASKEKWIAKMAPAELEFTKWSPIFRIDTYRFRVTKEHPPSYDGGFYGIRNKYFLNDLHLGGITHDGDACALMWGSDSDLSNYEVFEDSILKTPYLFLNQPKALVIGPGGGVDVGMALQSKAQSVLAVELDPITVDLVKNKYADFVGNLYQQPGVKVISDEGRSFLRRSHEKFDIIQMTGVDTLAALNSGAYVLAENYLYTTEAYRDFLDHLTDTGILSVANMDFHSDYRFPRHTARQVSLSIAALKERGISDPRQHIIVTAASMGDVWIPYVSIITRLTPFTFSEVAKVLKFAKEHQFDVWYAPGQVRNHPINYLVNATPEQREEYYRDNPLQLRAPSDNIPFFFHFYKWRTLLTEQEMDTGHTMATGQLILLLVLIFSIVFSVVLIVFPLMKFQRAGLQTDRKWNYIVYFAALGLGFIFIEISYIQRFILFLGYPTYSLTVILFSLLTFSGVGSFASGKLPLSPRKLITVALPILLVIVLSYMVLLPPIFSSFLGATRQVRIFVSLVLLFPLGFLLGMFFPTGIRIISEDDKHFVPWAWGINGCASVIGTVLSIIIAISYGFRVVTMLAAIIYLAGAYSILIASDRSRNVEVEG